MIPEDKGKEVFEENEMDTTEILSESEGVTQVDPLLAAANEADTQLDINPEELPGAPDMMTPEINNTVDPDPTDNR